MHLYAQKRTGNGAHTIKVEVSDHDGNAAAAQTVSFTVDTVPPTLSVTAPVDGLVTNSASLVVSGKTDDTTSKPVTVTVNGEKVAVNENGTWSKTLPSVREPTRSRLLLRIRQERALQLPVRSHWILVHR